LKAAILFAGMILASVGLWLAGVVPSARHNFLIEQAVAKPTDDGSLAAFLTIDNQGPPDRLLSVNSNVADVALYSPAADNGPPLQTGISSLALDAAHIRISQPESPFDDGSLVPMTLTFENAGPVNVKVRLSDPVTQGDAPSSGLFGFGDICIVGDGEPAPQVSLDVVQNGDGWQVKINSEEFTFSKDLLDLYHVPGMGHGHIYVGGMKLGRLFTPEYDIGPLPKGRHEVRVTLNTNDHRAYVVDDEPVTAFAFIEVD